jgi:hypothetical protein
VYIRGKPSIFHCVVFELQYRHGYTYLDRCGKTLNAIMKAHPEWVPRSEQVSPQVAPLVSTANQCVFNFSYKKLDFSLEQSKQAQIGESETESFCEQVKDLTTIVIDQLSLKEFIRIGLRSWYMFGCQDKEESENFLRDLAAFTIAPELVEDFGGEIESAGAAVVVAGTDRNYRIGFNGVERLAMVDLGSQVMSIRASKLPPEQGRRYGRRQDRESHRILAPPTFAAMIDIDAYQDEPQWPDPGDFARTSVSEARRRLEAFVKRAR